MFALVWCPCFYVYCLIVAFRDVWIMLDIWIMFNIENGSSYNLEERQIAISTKQKC